MLEFFLDFACPFSVKQAVTIDALWAAHGEQLASLVSIIFHNVPQPWHPQSTAMHEASFAAAAVDPSKQGAFWQGLMAAQSQFSDEHCNQLSRLALYEKLAPVAEQAGIDRAAFLALLPSDGITQQMKWACKMHRKRGVHVTPTVFANEIEAQHVSSGWTVEEWMELLQPFLNGV